MNHVLQKSMICLLGLGLAAMSTGCMTSPGHTEYIGDETDPVKFAGYLLDGNEWVKIQAKHPTHGWQTIGWAKSKNYSYAWSGDDWYPWSTDIVVPGSYWVSAGGGYLKAEVRAVQYSTNYNLPTFEAGFSSYWDYTETSGDLWNDHGHGASVTIFSNGPILY